MGIYSRRNQYGKAENRVVRIYRDTSRHEIVDLNVSTLAARRLRRGAHRRRPGRRAADRHPEEHRLRLRQGTRRQLAGGLRDRPRPPLPRRHPGRALGADPGRAVRLGSHPGRPERSRPRVRAARRRGPHGCRHRERPWRGRAGLGGLRRAGPGRAQVHRLGVQGLPQGSIHDPAGDRRPHPGHVVRGPVALRGHSMSTGTTPSRRAQAPCSTPSPRRTAERCRRRST